jgi:hypothetical protein
MTTYERLQPGRYRAINSVTVFTLHHSTATGWTRYEPGEVIEIQPTANGFWAGAQNLAEDFPGEPGIESPKYERISD